MQDYYDIDGIPVGRANSFMECWRPMEQIEKHPIHIHDADGSKFGPFLCPGWPEQEVFDTGLRHALNPQPVEEIPPPTRGEILADALTKASSVLQAEFKNNLKKLAEELEKSIPEE